LRKAAEWCGGVVDEQSIDGRFAKLEDKIRSVVHRCRDLQQTKSALEAKIYELEEALKIKVAAEQRYIEEKSVIGAKIEGLLGRLDQAVD
jgi:chromosome segregation ATPase